MSTLRKKTLEVKKLEEIPIQGEPPVNEKEEKYLKEVAEYEFYNTEQPGVPYKAPYGSTKKFANLYFEHGKRYKIPRHVARHVESCSTPINKWNADGSGAMTKTTVGKNSRFQMRPVFS